MTKRLGRAETTQVILDTMDRMMERAKRQDEFTADKVATAAGVSVQLLYRYAGPEFRARRDRLPGPRVGEESIITLLRRELEETTRKLRVLSEEHDRCATAADIEAVLLLNEQLEVANRALRTQNEYLRPRATTDVLTAAPGAPTSAGRPRLVTWQDEEG